MGVVGVALAEQLVARDSSFLGGLGEAYALAGRREDAWSPGAIHAILGNREEALPSLDDIMFSRNAVGFKPVSRRAIEGMIDLYVR